MKKLTNVSKSYIIKLVSIISLSLILSFLLGFFITSIVNRENSYYQCQFTYDGNKDLSQIINVEYLNSIKQTDENKYKSVDVKSLVSKKDISISYENNIYTINTKSKYYENFFYISKNQVGTRAKTFIKLALTNFIDENETIAFLDSENIVKLMGNYSPYLGGVYGLCGGVFISIILLCFVKNKKRIDIEDNVTLFHTPFHLEYWKHPFEVFKDTRRLVMLAMLFSLLLVSKLFSLPSGFGNLGISLAYIFLAIIGLLYGPYLSLIIGCLSDIIGYFITPHQSVFYLGYTLQAALAVFTYSLCFYKTRITFGKVLLSRLIVNMLLNVVLGSYLQCRLFVMSNSLNNELFWTTFKTYALAYSLPKNIVYLIPQSLILFLVFKGVIPILSQFKLIDERVKDNITII